MGWDIHYGKFVDLSYSIPQAAESEEIFQSIDSGLSWTEPSLPNGIWTFTSNGVPMHMVRIAQLESGRTYLFKTVVTGGPNAGNSNIVTYTAH